MKKIITIAAAAIALLCCSTNAPAQDDGGDLNKSISEALGKLYGHGNASILKHNADSTEFDTDAFISSLKATVYNDTATIAVSEEGMYLGEHLLKMQESFKKLQNVDLNINAFIAEFEKAFVSDSMPNLQELEMEVNELMQRASAEAKAKDPEAIKNKQEGEEYLAKKVAEGYTKTESGIAYKVLAEGAGENFTADQTIDIRYEGRFVDGTVFDSTKGDNTIALVPTQVVLGFEEALLLMKPGMKIEVVIPSDLAYGIDGAGGIIGPNATLIFTIEAVGVHADK